MASGATGGYLGSWGPEGKLMTVHENELLLNKVDTQKFFDLADKLTDINDFIDANALSQCSSNLASLFNQMAQFSKDNETIE
jgi:hypothetical protein